jgi:hypothetical protein
MFKINFFYFASVGKLLTKPVLRAVLEIHVSKQLVQFIFSRLAFLILS